MLIGLCGPAGAGKNTVADYLCLEHGFRQLGFADPLYEAVSVITKIPVDQLKDRKVKERPISWLGSSPRELLQTLGTDWGRKMIHENIWIISTMNRIADDLEAGRNVVITDVRFDNEAMAIKLAGGEVWKIDRDGNSCIGGSAEHESERGVSAGLIDTVIKNDSTVEALHASAEARVLQSEEASY